MKLKIVLLLLALGVLGSTSGIALVASSQTSNSKLGFGFRGTEVPGKDYKAGDLIVMYNGSSRTQSLTQAASASGGQAVKEIKGKAVLLKFPDEATMKAAARQLAARPEVKFVEANGIMSIPPTPVVLPKTTPGLGSRTSTTSPSSNEVTTQAVSTDSGTGLQWHHTVIRKTANLGTLSTTPPTIAVIDTGVDYNHPDLAGKVILGIDTINGDMDPMDDNQHGTHVAGLAAAKARNNQYGEGVSPNSKILAIKVLNAEGSGDWFSVAQGMEYARTAVTSPPTKVINMSLGGGFSQLIADQVAAIKASGKLLVAAAGNSNTTSTSSAFPGADPNTGLRVMATEQNDCRAYFSNFSPATAATQYNIAAPGWMTPSTLPNDGYGALSGTSMASPIVAGSAAFVWGQLSNLTAAQLTTRLINNGKSIDCGFAAATRRVDVRKAILETAETAIVGRLLDPFTGKAPSPDATPAKARLFSGTTQLSADASNRSGFYEMTGLAAGTGRSLSGNNTGYINDTLRRSLNIASGVANGPFTDALPQARSTGNATITLDWKTLQPIIPSSQCGSTNCLGWEFDLYVKTPSGEYIGRVNSGNLNAVPFVKWPRNSFDLTSAGLVKNLESLETVVVGSNAANGIYRVIVHRPFSTSLFNPSWTGSLASAQFYNGAASLGAQRVPPGTCGTNSIWYVGNLTKSGTTYTFQAVNTCSNTAP